MNSPEPAPGAATSMVLDIRFDESVYVDGPAQVTPVHKSGQQVRLRVTAPRATHIRRGSDAPKKAVASVR